MDRTAIDEPVTSERRQVAPLSTDEELARAAQAGDPEAAEALVRRYFASVWRASYAITRRRDSADDVAQDAFERFIRHLPAFDPTRPVAPYLHKIAVNCAISLLRKRRREQPLPDEWRDDAGSAAVETTARVRELMRAMEGLGADHRAVVVLRLLLGYSVRETAEALEIPEGTVHSRLSRAIGMIRTTLDA